MNNDARIAGLLVAAGLGLASVSQPSFAVCTAGTVDTAFGPASTGGYVQYSPVFLGVSGGLPEGIVVTTGDDGIAANMMAGIDTTGSSVLGLAKFKRGGALDSTFGGFGISSPGGFASTGGSSGLAQDPSGNLTVARVESTGVTVTRFSSGGNLDLTFGTNGTASAALTNVFGGPVNARAGSDGSVFVAAASNNPSAPNAWQATVVKFTNTGALDSSFGSGGIAYAFPASITGPGTWARATDVYPLAGGGVLVAGRLQSAAGHRVFFVGLLQADGSVDTTFGSGGFALTDFSPAYPFAQGRRIAVQADGKIVIVGTISNGPDNAIGLARLLPNGLPDTTFGTGGQTVATQPFGLFGFDVAIQNNNKVLVGGSILSATVDTAALIRFTAAGALDTAFGSGGFVSVLPPGWPWSDGDEVIYLPGGKILLRVDTLNTTTSQATSFLVRVDSGSGPGCH